MQGIQSTARESGEAHAANHRRRAALGAGPLVVAALEPSGDQSPLAEAEPSPRLAREIQALPACQTLYASGDYSVTIARRPQIPHLMNEIGRLREQSFRRVGEGTGKERDVDEYDDWYMQLFVWNRKSQEVLGAYRLAMTDVVLRTHGVRGLYSSSLFRFGEEFLRNLGPAVELGRSFVRAEARGAGRVLALLWRGIGHLIAARPQYRTLFGPVSVSAAYSEESRRLIATRLCSGPFLHPLRHYVRPLRPVEPMQGPFAELEEDIRGLSRRVAELEPQGQQLPILLREYVKLGGQFLAFSVDPDFGDAMDGFVAVDLERTSSRLLALHMGAENYERFVRAGHSMRPRKAC